MNQANLNRLFKSTFSYGCSHPILHPKTRTRCSLHLCQMGSRGCNDCLMSSQFAFNKLLKVWDINHDG